MGRMHSDAQLTLFSSFSLGKISKFLLRSLVRRFAGFSSVNFVFLLLARQSKLVCFALTRASVPAHVDMMGFLGIGQVMCKWVNGSLLTFTTNVAITRKRQQPNGWCYCCLRPTMAALVEKRTSKLCVSLVGTLFFHRSGYRRCIEQVIS